MARSKFNLLNIAKKRDLFRCFIADEGHKLIYQDYSSLEPHVAAHISQDKNLMKIYGKGRPPNDIYLFTGSNFGLSSKQVRQYYDPDNPTKESIKLAKSKLADIRPVFKSSFLKLLYGAYPKGLHRGLVLDGFDVTLHECRQMFDDFHHMYPGLKTLERRMVKMWGENGGYIINGRGRPVAIAEEKLRDINNTIFQGTGHDILMADLVIVNRLRLERGVSLTPYLFDWHDSKTFQAADKDVEAGCEIYREALYQINQMLNWTVEIKGDVKVGNTLADFLDD